MSSAKKSSRGVRTNIVLPQEVSDILEQIAADSNTNKTAVIRQAIALMKLAHEEKKKGRHLGFTDSSDKLDTEIVGAF